MVIEFSEHPQRSSIIQKKYHFFCQFFQFLSKDNSYCGNLRRFFRNDDRTMTIISHLKELWFNLANIVQFHFAWRNSQYGKPFPYTYFYTS